MPSTYTPNNNIEKPATGEQTGTWGNTANVDFNLLDQSLDGILSLAVTGAPVTLPITAGVVSNGRNRILLFTGVIFGDVTVSITPQTAQKWFFVQNNTTGGFSVIIHQGSGSTVAIREGATSLVMCDGAGTGASVKEILNGLRIATGLDTPLIALEGATSGVTVLAPQAVAGNTVMILPAANDQLVGRATTDTLTGKSISGSTNTLTAIPNSALVHPSMTLNGVVVNLGDTATIPAVLGHSASSGSGLTGGTFDGTANITYAIDPAIVATLAGIQTLTNKTLTAPVMTAPVLGTPASGNLSNCTNVPVDQAVNILPVAHGGTGTATPSLVAGTNITITGTYPNQTVTASATAATAFSALTSSTNNTAAMVVGTGASLAASGSGTIGATSVAGLSVASGKTLTVSNSITMAGTDGTVMTHPTTSATLARTDAANTFIGHQTIEGVTSTGATGTGNLVFGTSPALVTPNLGTPSAINLTNATNVPIPIATTVVVGGVKQGTGVTIAGDGTLAATYQLAIGGAVTSGTAASILFLNGSSQLSQNAANFNWDDTNKRLNISNPAAVDSKINVGGGVLTTTAQDQAPLVKLQTSDGSGAHALEFFELRASPAGNTSASAFYRIQRNIAGTRGCYIEMGDHGLNLGQTGTTTAAKFSLDSTGNLTLYESLEVSTAAGGPATVGIGTAPVAGQQLTLGGAGGLIALTTGEVGISATPTSSSGFPFTVGGAKCNGTTWANASDMAIKTAFDVVDEDSILDKLMALPVTSWEYISKPGERYIGPTAQDFAEAFGATGDDKSISTLHADGVMMSCIKALVKRLHDLEKKIVGE